MPSCRRRYQAADAARVDEDIDPYKGARRGGYQPPAVQKSQ